MSNGDRDRLLFLLDTVAREGHQLLGTSGRLFATRVDASWVANLEHQPEAAERVDAFAARFGRMQDTIGDKLIPELRRQLLARLRLRPTRHGGCSAVWGGPG